MLARTTQRARARESTQLYVGERAMTPTETGGQKAAALHKQIMWHAYGNAFGNVHIFANAYQLLRAIYDIHFRTNESTKLNSRLSVCVCVCVRVAVCADNSCIV